MGFYEQISEYYDYIFPVGRAQLEFIKSSAGDPPKRLLDVACGSGGYSEALAKSGYSIISIDLDEKMVEMAGKKAVDGQLDMEVMKSDMGNIAEAVPGCFDCIFCIGNSLVHLGSIEEIKDSLIQMRTKLLTGGSLLLQIINFDRVLKYGISSLPEIEVGEIRLKFVRKYIHDEVSKKIHFATVLTVEGINGFERYENSVELLPLTSTELIRLMKEAGFKKVKVYGDFERGSFSVDSYLMVIEGIE